MKELDVKKLSFDCKCPNCKKWWTCGKDDLKSKVVSVMIPTHPGNLGSPSYPANRTRYFVNCADCQAEIVVTDIHPALLESLSKRECVKKG